MNVNVKLGKGAKMPEYATKGAACFDIYAVEEERSERVRMSDYGSVFSTGLFFEIPENHVMLVFSRSGHGFKQNIRLANCVGVIDSDYRGELKVKLIRDTSYNSGVINTNSAIAQGMIIKYDNVIFNEVQELSDTDRGTGGFGSTNK